MEEEKRNETDSSLASVLLCGSSDRSTGNGRLNLQDVVHSDAQLPEDLSSEDGNGVTSGSPLLMSRELEVVVGMDTEGEEEFDKLAQKEDDIISEILDWKSFDVFHMSSLTNGRPLCYTTLRVLETLGMFERLQLPLHRMKNFLMKAEYQYCDPSYHNSIHAADVVQALGSILMADKLITCLTDIETLAVVISAAVHDIGHPGVNNDFHARTNSKIARKYSSSYNEKMHVELALKTLEFPDCDFLTSVGESSANEFKDLLQDLILSTDMVWHRSIVSDFQKSVEKYGSNVKYWPSSCRRGALRMLLHCADISNPARPWVRCQEWGRRVQEELYFQGDKEKAMGLQVSPICDRRIARPAFNQFHFIGKFMLPCFRALQPVSPNFTAETIPAVEESLMSWKHLCQEKTTECNYSRKNRNEKQNDEESLTCSKG